MRALLAAAALLLASPALAAEAEITVDNFTFSPPVLTVPAGTSVTWDNRDDIPHLIVGRDDPAALHSPLLDTGDRYTTVFAKPGTYAYFCSLHPHMQGTVVVR